MTGFIYAIECRDRIKLGYSKNPEARFRKISVEIPYPSTLLGYWPGRISDERAVHKRFKSLRVHAEWFEVTDELSAFVRERIKSRAPSPRSASPLAAWRKRRGLTQEDLAAKLGVGRSFVAHLENGISGPSIEVAVMLAKITDGEVPIESLLRKKEAAGPERGRRASA